MRSRMCALALALSLVSSITPERAARAAAAPVQGLGALHLGSLGLWAVGGMVRREAERAPRARSFSWKGSSSFGLHWVRGPIEAMASRCTSSDSRLTRCKRLIPKVFRER